MRKQKAFTLIELLVVISVIAVLMAILMPALNRAKEAAKRTVCLNNLKSLQMAWSQYADDNSERICSGRTGSTSNGAPMWCGNTGGNGTQQEREQRIKDGALWRYQNTAKVYRCPTALPSEMVTYSVVDAQNGAITTQNGGNLGQGMRDERGVYILNKTDIVGPAERLVFVDEGYATPDSFTVYYKVEGWWDEPPVRHGKGAAFSYADAHAEHHMWRGAGTIELGQRREYGASLGVAQEIGHAPDSSEEADDLHWLQKGCWGKLGYAPRTW